VKRARLAVGILALLACLPALSLLGHEGAYLAGPYSELPVRLWAFETFSGVSFLGGEVAGVGFPNSGLLNNPDPLGSALMPALLVALSRPCAYNLLVTLHLLLNMLAVWLLARDLLRDELAALTAATAFGLTPLLLVYPLLCAITDLLILWPYPLAILFALRALRRQGWRDGLLAGLMAGIGFVTCPYNVVVFGVILFPALLFFPLAWRVGLVPVEDPLADAGRRQWPRAAAGLVLGMGLSAGWYLLWMKFLMAGPDSQVSERVVLATRHAPPFSLLGPWEIKRFTAFLVDYVAVGKQALIEREVASRFYRAFSPGLCVLGLAGVGLWSWKGRRATVLFWLAIALFAALASTGPFLPLDVEHSFQRPYNLAWLSQFYLIPGGKLILEPFRYGLVAALGLALAASVGTLALMRRWGRWLGWLFPLVYVVELCLLSPVPVPLPVAQPMVSGAYQRLDEVLPPGPIVELPYFDRGSQRFARMHFLNQLEHGRPIADEVLGFPPRYMAENQFTAALLAAEEPQGAINIKADRPWQARADRERLARDGFVGLILDPGAFSGPDQLARAKRLLEPLGEPLLLEDRLVYPIGPWQGAGAADSAPEGAR